jgi:tRNA(Ile)-lysidine synthase TilS/MesJ
MALTIDPGSNVFDTTELEAFCKELNIEYVIEKTNIKEVVFDIRKEKNPCSLCANLRRGALNGVAEAHGCNKVALGHHQDDVIETFFLSLFYEGKIHTFSPATYLSRKNIVTIRPMIYVTEKDVKSFAKRNPLPIMKKNCEMDGKSKREYMKDLIKNLTKDIPKLRACVFGAITRSNIPGWKIDEE